MEIKIEDLKEMQDSIERRLKDKFKKEFDANDIEICFFTSFKDHTIDQMVEFDLGMDYLEYFMMRFCNNRTGEIMEMRIWEDGWEFDDLKKEIGRFVAGWIRRIEKSLEEIKIEREKKRVISERESNIKIAVNKRIPKGCDPIIRHIIFNSNVDWHEVAKKMIEFNPELLIKKEF